ncbi:MAG: dTMP kinase [Phycisphaerae bacterium]
MDDASLAHHLQGRFIVFDGPDGAGKSTQLTLLADRLTTGGADVVCCRDPGGTTIGDRIRSVLLDFDLSTMDVACETMLFMASRAQLVAEVVRPAMNLRRTVLCDRFVTATCAYQGAAGYDVRRVIDLAGFAIGDTWPAVTLVLDVDADEGFARIAQTPAPRRKRRARPGPASGPSAGATPDAMEARPIEFHRRVRERFLELHETYPAPIVVLDGRGDVETVHHRVLECLGRVTF